MARPGEQTLAAEVLIAAEPAAVWAVLVDPATMTRISPELFATSRVPSRMRGGPLRAGERFVGWNRRGALVWPTRNTVLTADPPRELCWRTETNGVLWRYALAADPRGTIVCEQRLVPDGITPLARLFAAAFLGGSARHADELAGHVSLTLARLRELCETPAG